MGDLNVIFVVILVGGWLGGRIAARLKLPSILGMMLVGVGVGFALREHAPDAFWELAPLLRSTALIIILLRAGLGVRRSALARSGPTAAMLAFVPCVLEGSALTAILHFLWGFPLFEAGAAAFMLAAVSPAVVVPSMLTLMEQGYGKAAEVPTTVLAGASVDDVFAITAFTIFLNLATGAAGADPTVAGSLLLLPLGLAGGIGLGAAIGFGLAAWLTRHFERIRATEKFLLVLAISIMAVRIGEYLHLAALLGTMTIGFILLERSEPVAHELAAKLAKAWVFAEIILFVLIGAAVDPVHAVSVGLAGVATITAGLAARSVGVIIAVAFSGFSWKERLFCVIAYLPKATVQAALGSVPLAAGLANGESILSLAVLAILFTAPLGLLGIRILGPRLLDVPLPPDDEDD